ncbi:MAG: hypothetical protein ABSA81_08490 [Candidatus Bathyarchaeia archaeon]
MLESGQEERHLEELNEKERSFRERAYFPAQNLGLVLLEIFHLDQKRDLASGLTSMFESAQMLELDDLRDKGILAAGWSERVGTIYPGDSHRWPADRGDVYKGDLPQPFAWVDIHVGQVFDFCFYLVANCLIKADHRDSIKDKFLQAGVWRTTRQHDDTTIESRAGPELEPTMREYQRQIEEYLSRFVKGIFLSRETAQSVRCPSIRVMVSDSVDFQNYDSWVSDHALFLRFLLGTYGFIASRLECWLISYQEDRMFKEASVSSGVNFVCSKVGFRSVSDNPIEEQIFENASHIFRTWLLLKFVATYWSHYQLELPLPEWQTRCKNLEEDLRKVLGASKITLKSLRNNYSEAFRLLNSFEQYALEEERNVRTMLAESSRGIPTIDSEPANRTGIKLDVLRNFIEDRGYLDEEKAHLNNVRRIISSVTYRCRQFTDFKVAESNERLTAGIRSLTWLLVLLTTVLGGFQIYAYLVPSGKLTPFSTYAWMIISALLVAFAVVIGMRSLIDEERRTLSKTPSLKTITRIILIVTLVLGVLLSANGAYTWGSSLGGSYNNLASIGTSTILGWDPSDLRAVHPIIGIGVVPFQNSSLTSVLIFNIMGTIYTNKTFTLEFISPLLIGAVGEERGNWSYQNVANLGSIVYYTYKLNSSLEYGDLAGISVFYVTNLPARFDHGSYRIFIPFGGGLTPQFQSAMNMTRLTIYRGSANFEFDLDIPLTYRITSSYPSFTSTKPVLGPVCCGSQKPLQALEYELNGSAALSASYEDSEAISNFAASQSLELFCLGLGVPLLLSSALELARLYSSDKSSAEELVSGARVHDGRPHNRPLTTEQ